MVAISAQNIKSEDTGDRAPFFSTIDLRVDGMTCTGCAAAIKESLSKAAGVESVECVSLETDSASISYNASVISSADIIIKVKDAGFRASCIETGGSAESMRMLLTTVVCCCLRNLSNCILHVLYALESICRACY